MMTCIGNLKMIKINKNLLINHQNKSKLNKIIPLVPKVQMKEQK